MYIRKFSQQSCVQIEPGEYKKSTYLPMPMKKCLQYLAEAIPDTYILCPWYENGQDYQIGLTGTVKKGEGYTDAVMREIGEEIGLIPLVVSKFRSYPWGGPLGNFAVYTAKISDCSKVPPEKHDTIVSEGKDQREKKVGCFVYGSLIHVLDFLNSSEIYRYYSPDGIGGIVGVKISDL